VTAPLPTIGRDGAADAPAQQTARGFVVALHAAVRAVRLYPIENSAVQKAIADLVSAAVRVASADGPCRLQRIGDYLFVNETRLRLTLDNYAAVAYVLGLLREAGLGGVAVVAPTTSRDWVVLLAFLQAPPLEYPEEQRLEQLLTRVEQAGVECFECSPPIDDSDGQGPAMDAKERSRQTYVRSLDVTREVMASVRIGRSPGLKRVKRAVQGIVDAILTDPASLIGLTTLREFDEYTFVHSVNVSILSVALGRRLGFTRPQLLDLGLAALLHDIGKSRVPLELLNKRGSLDDQERALLQTHTWQGVLAMFAMPTTGTDHPWRAMTTAHEHHMRVDLTGYPKPFRSRRLTLFSKIVAVADGFDAATTSRASSEPSWTPADVLRGMRDDTRLGFDPVLVKAFINLTGIYPVGTLVVLDSFALAMVVAANPDPTALSRPLVRMITDALGNRLVDPQVYDLTSRDASGQFAYTIIRTEDPQRYGINFRDYFA
jgi:HD-GYP domain-containing protein (c-di-GMP phosphodiesterase class II)